ncbi:hypothetical protein KQI38_09565 [Tissierella carlieri]|jgi:3-oxoacyl-[acyl-carrier-protein] synthase-3|uniref:3-oxoacyl-[acyl-carrier-protein] synthase III C-terminal domain-containing protein n=1 Tax=Tissierella carlieri TaxID=689904 RepID=UPI001C0FB20D|nr:3-oxoacyl-[acyl-carrier-protein] synthase III C-terminal domain-containing protein [Tissierella carlieri]MBU5312275.1 hypothetical protein [Tissierella carlieri]MDU5081536.1 3-oxoacyl-[acyl-carrier-protein] synthase III C-terminal domain-containing protein [Bacillota bacterium]
MKGIKILSSSIYHPENKITKEEILENFDSKGIDVRGLMETLGRNQLYKTKNENIIEMCVIAGQQAIKKAGIQPEDIDMLIFASDNPEYLAPSNSLILHSKLGTVNANNIFDFNNNCLSMVSAMDYAGKYMMASKDIETTIILGGQMMNFFSREDDAVIRATSGDGAACLILRKEEVKDNSGIIDSIYLTESFLNDKMRLPVCGMSNILNEDIDVEDKKALFISHDVSFFTEKWSYLIKELVKRNGLEVGDISHFIFSQFSLKDIENTLGLLEVKNPKDKYTFIADKYGYTGSASPIFALNEAYNLNRINDSDYIIFCTVGIGYSMTALLYRA